MNRSWSALAGLVIGTFCILNICCQKQTDASAQSKPEPAATAQSETETAAQTTEPGPKITFETDAHDFSEVGPATDNICEFKFKNTGDSLLEIKEIKTTCGCTVPELKKKEYAPGESGTITIHFQAPASPGVTAKRIYVHSNDKKTPTVSLSVKASIVIKITHSPERLNLFLKKENAACPEITITALDNQSFAVTGFKSTADSITAAYDPSVTATKFVLQPEVDMQKLEKGLSGNISISLTHPDCTKITIPFGILTQFRVDPPVIVILNAQPCKPVVREVWLFNNYGENFEIKSTASEKGFIRVLSQEKSDNMYKFKLEITPPVAEENKKIFLDSFLVSIKDADIQKVTCRGFYSAKTAKTKEPSGR